MGQHPDAALDDGRKDHNGPVPFHDQGRDGENQSRSGRIRFGQVKYEPAAALFDEIIAADTLAEFLTLKAYDHLEGYPRKRLRTIPIHSYQEAK
jgi:hypothetical protein